MGFLKLRYSPSGRTKQSKIFAGFFIFVFAVFMFVPYFYGQAFTGYNITQTSSSISGLQVNIGGTASAHPYAGQLNQQHVSIDWGEDLNATMDCSVAQAGTLNITSSDSNNFDGTWSGAHTYSAAGTYHIFARVHHQNCNGGESGDNTIEIILVLPTPTPTPSNTPTPTPTPSPSNTPTPTPSASSTPTPTPTPSNTPTPTPSPSETPSPTPTSSPTPTPTPTPSDTPTPTPETTTSGGGGGGGGGGVGTLVTPTPEVAGTATVSPTPAPQVLGASTTKLPATSTSVTDRILLSLFSAFLLTGMLMLFVGYGLVPQKIAKILD